MRKKKRISLPINLWRWFKLNLKIERQWSQMHEVMTLMDEVGTKNIDWLIKYNVFLCND